MSLRAVLRTATAAVAALVMVAVLAGCSGGKTAQVRSITLTLVRHGESVANAENVIDTRVPGPGLTEYGVEQAAQVAAYLAQRSHDAVYSSSMLRAEQSAEPLARQLGEQVQVLPGLREIEAGWYEGKSASTAELTYLLAPMGWAAGEHQMAIPGSIDGAAFNDRFSAAIQKIYESNASNPVAFSHGAAISAWTVLNAKNPSTELIAGHPLPNAGVVVLTGNPSTGWRLVEWDGTRV